ncbi:MAG: transporter ATP-binding protein [Rhodospirillales bacterium]|jgi:ABC-type nitrate/sulfonate/bicarbonate transport system ATPase subunit|nr:transporter ATP-binding protein [Rhodospirillales bacterium]
MSGIVVEHLGKSFVLRDGKRFVALDDVSLTAADGEFCCLVGPSGCGKSTVLNIIASLVTPDSGSIRFSSGAGKTRIGYVFQKSRLLPWKSVRDNLALALAGAGVRRDEFASRIQHYLAMMGLERFAGEYPAALSGGMQQRVAIARAIAIEPDILLMDEPFGALDEFTARAARRHLLRIWEETHKTILFVTHNAFEAAYMADRVMLFTAHPGRLVRTVTVDVPRSERAIDEPRLLAVQKEILATLGLE